MQLSFKLPIILSLIPVIIAVIIIISKIFNGNENMSYSPKFTALFFRKLGSREKMFVFLRSLSVCFLIISMAGITILNKAELTATIFAIDSSDSMRPNIKEAENFIKNAISIKGKNDYIGVVNFASNSATEINPNIKPDFTEIQTSVNTSFTNIQKAVMHAEANMPADMKKRIVIISDGIETSGHVDAQIKTLANLGTIVDVFPFQKAIAKEVQLTKVDVPQKASKGQMLDIIVEIDSSINTTTEMFVYRESEIVDKKIVDIDKGKNRFVFSDLPEQGGIVPYKFEIVPAEDTMIQNNTAFGYCDIEDRPRILLVQGMDRQGEQLYKIIEKDVNVTVVSSIDIPTSMEELIKYDGFILCNLSIEELKDEFLNTLEDLVKHQGKGLLVTGGDNSYGVGGYYQTTLEEILPVKMDIKQKEDKPNLALVLVIDKSGSMTSGRFGVSKLELAKEAAIRSTEILDKKDMLGVIAFDSSAKWVIETQKVENVEELQDKIATVRAGGGTTILPSLKQAVDSLKNANAKLKHIILLTDGRAETQGYNQVIEDMNSNKITLSTVAVGQGADRNLLKSLALGGQGRYYSTDEFTDIPKIFTKEAFMAGRKYLNNITFNPTINMWSEILKGFEVIPQLNGYVATQKKDVSRVLLSGPNDDPILATWQYGLGRTVAWTSDAKGIWTSNLLNWDMSSYFWKNIISWMISSDVGADFVIETEYKDGMGIITLTNVAKNTSLGSMAAGILISPNGTKEEITLQATAPGVYTGTFIPKGEGVYIADVAIDLANEQKRFTAGVTVGWSPEFNILSNTQSSLNRIVELSGGRILESYKDVFKVSPPNTSSDKNISNYFLVIALIIFLIEIIIRKLNLNPINRVKLIYAGTSSLITENKKKHEDEKLVKDKKVNTNDIKHNTKIKNLNKTRKKEKAQTEHISRLLAKKNNRE